MAERSAADRLGTVTLPEHLYPSTSFRQRKNKTRTTLGVFCFNQKPTPRDTPPPTMPCLLIPPKQFLSPHPYGPTNTSESRSPCAVERQTCLHAATRPRGPGEWPSGDHQGKVSRISLNRGHAHTEHVKRFVETMWFCGRFCWW